MNELQEIRRLLADHYFGQGDFVRRFHLVVSAEERRPVPVLGGGMWPESYLLCAQARIRGRDYDFVELIDKDDFIAARYPEAIVARFWVAMRRGVILKKEELRDAVLCG